MKRSTAAAGLCFFVAATACAQTAAPAIPKKDDVLALQRKVALWQIGQMDSEWNNPATLRRNTDWKRGVLFTGLVSAYESTNEPKILEALKRVGETNNYKIGSRRRHADDQLVGEMYLFQYAKEKDDKWITDIRSALDAQQVEPMIGREEWTWCDALFMAPTTWVRMSNATGDARYADLADRMWWDTHDHLYSNADHLWYRDARFFPGAAPQMKEKNGNSIFWSRGNGWVIAGSARMLSALPSDYPNRPRYERLLREMAEKLASVQQPDGFWHSSLLDPASFPNPETSGTGLHTFAIAWGINHGVLDREKYLPVVLKSWKALESSVFDDGKLGWVQREGDRSSNNTKDESYDFGVGAFLLAAGEVAKLNEPVMAAGTAPAGWANPNASSTVAQAPVPLVMTVTNTLDIARSEIIEIPWSTITAKAGSAVNAQTLVVMDATQLDPSDMQVVYAGKEPQSVLVRVFLDANETQKLRITTTAPAALNDKAPTEMLTMVRFVPERIDDFAFENDKVAFRMYGPAQAKAEPVGGSGIDIWSKRAGKLVMNDWYKTGNYHANHNGEGMDAYKVGAGRGCGGLGFVREGRVYNSGNFVTQRVISSGPLRSVFELTYAPWGVGLNDTKVAEIKRVTIDAGEYLARYESTFTWTGANANEVYPYMGLTIHDGDNVVVTGSRENGTITLWETPEKDAGKLGTAVVYPGGSAVSAGRQGDHVTLVTRDKNRVVYYAGGAWDGGGVITTAEAWQKHVDEFAKRAKSPVKVEFSSNP